MLGASRQSERGRRQPTSPVSWNVSQEVQPMTGDKQGNHRCGPTLTDWLVYVVARIAMCLVQALPIETCQTLSRGLAFLCWQVLRIRREVVEENLRHAFPELGDAQRGSLGWRCGSTSC